MWRWQIARAIELGKLPRIDDWMCHAHEWPELAWPDPLKETQTQAGQMMLGTTSLHRILGGNSWRDVLREQALEQQERDQHFIERVAKAYDACQKLQAKYPDLNLSWSQVIASTGAINQPAAYLDAVAKTDAANAAASAPAPAPAKRSTDATAAQGAP